MKNIFILPTNEPSNLYKSNNGLFTTKEKYKFDNRENQFLYITNNEEIKVGDWYLNTLKNNIDKCEDIISQKNVNLSNWLKKIILTTYPKLIADIVQPIPNDFLEWLCKNSSCESVEVEPLLSNNGRALFGYKIIIPKEEPKFEDSIKNSVNIMSIANSMFGKKEESKQETAVEWLVEQLNNHTKNNDFLITFENEISKAKEMEKQQLINFGYSQISYIDSEIGDLIYKKVPEEIYNEKFNK